MTREYIICGGIQFMEKIQKNTSKKTSSISEMERIKIEVEAKAKLFGRTVGLFSKRHYSTI